MKTLNNSVLEQKDLMYQLNALTNFIDFYDMFYSRWVDQELLDDVLAEETQQFEGAEKQSQRVLFRKYYDGRMLLLFPKYVEKVLNFLLLKDDVQVLNEGHKIFIDYLLKNENMEVLKFYDYEVFENLQKLKERNCTYLNGWSIYIASYEIISKLNSCDSNLQ